MDELNQNEVSVLAFEVYVLEDDLLTVIEPRRQGLPCSRCTRVLQSPRFRRERASCFMLLLDDAVLSDKRKIPDLRALRVALTRFSIIVPSFE